MEPSDFDKFIKNKVQEDVELHQHERDTAKPFIWSAIHHGLANRWLNWRHLAAAVLLLAIGFSLVFQMDRRTHQQELYYLNEKIGALQEKYQNQLTVLAEKNNEVNDTHHTDLPQKERIVYKTDTIFKVDTVFIKVKEYITVAAPTTEQVRTPLTVNTVEDAPNDIDESIYPHFTDQEVKRKTETIQLKLGSFTARRD